MWFWRLTSKLNLGPNKQLWIKTLLFFFFFLAKSDLRWSRTKCGGKLPFPGAVELTVRSYSYTSFATYILELQKCFKMFQRNIFGFLSASIHENSLCKSLYSSHTTLQSWACRLYFWAGRSQIEENQEQNTASARNTVT